MEHVITLRAVVHFTGTGKTRGEALTHAENTAEGCPLPVDLDTLKIIYHGRRKSMEEQFHELPRR